MLSHVSPFVFSDARASRIGCGECVHAVEDVHGVPINRSPFDSVKSKKYKMFD
jgi:hypothetical protein